jgi:hypothetical protein
MTILKKRWWIADPVASPCKYTACPKCDACNVCMDFHGNFVAGCTEPCPYKWYHRLRDWFRRRDHNLGRGDGNHVGTSE